MIARRHAWAALILVVSAGAVALLNPGTDPAHLQDEIMTRMRTTLESADPEQHQHAGHGAQQPGEVICGVRVYGHEPAEAEELAEVRTVYGFHLCGVAEPGRPWDVAVKLAGPVILDMTTDPAGIRVVEATADVKFIDRLHEMFPPVYAELASREALSEAEAADLRRRYDEAAF
ncbi:hypothetical protein AB0F72_26035 [Actinoplanes sp. NPDC023936]|uniref:hypothetical protein n=1 Tax=Actinoplanes sp. NPDC023936 TaxID=3154910 RepID=UPI0033F45542